MAKLDQQITFTISFDIKIADKLLNAIRHFCQEIRAIDPEAEIDYSGDKGPVIGYSGDIRRGGK